MSFSHFIPPSDAFSQKNDCSTYGRTCDFHATFIGLPLDRGTFYPSVPIQADRTTGSIKKRNYLLPFANLPEKQYFCKQKHIHYMNNDILMTPDMCMRFLVWSYFYHNILPDPAVSYAEAGRFSEEDVRKLDDLRDTLFRCFEQESVIRACAQFARAKQTGEACPFTQAELDITFAAEKL